MARVDTPVVPVKLSEDFRLRMFPPTEMYRDWRAILILRDGSIENQTFTPPDAKRDYSLEELKDWVFKHVPRNIAVRQWMTIRTKWLELVADQGLLQNP